jgi:membrane associated rhomboid family serine protease
MPRAQKKRAARAAAVSETTPRVAPSRVRSPASEDTGPQPWSFRGLLILAGLVAVLQLPLALLDLVRNGGGHNYGVYLIASLAPISLPQQIEILVAFVIVMPVARRLGGEGRSMGMLETLGLGAVSLIVLTILWQFALIAAGGDPVDRKGNVSPVALVAGAFADVAGLVGGALLYPRIQRWFRRRGTRR